MLVGVEDGVLVGVDVGVLSRDRKAKVDKKAKDQASEFQSVHALTDRLKAQNKKLWFVSLTDVGVDVGVLVGVDVGVDVGV